MRNDPRFGTNLESSNPERLRLTFFHVNLDRDDRSATIPQNPCDLCLQFRFATLYFNSWISCNFVAVVATSFARKTWILLASMWQASEPKALVDARHDRWKIVKRVA